MTEDEHALEANLTALNVASAENWVAAIHLLTSCCGLTSFGGMHFCIWRNQRRVVRLKKEAEAAADWNVLRRVNSGFLSLLLNCLQCPP